MGTCFQLRSFVTTRMSFHFPFKTSNLPLHFSQGSKRRPSSVMPPSGGPQRSTHYISWQSPPSTWWLDWAYTTVLCALGAIFIGLMLLTLVSKLTGGRRILLNIALKPEYVLINAALVGYLIVAPSSNFLVRYTCSSGAEGRDVSGVSDMFGEGAYLGWLITGISTFFENEILGGGTFFFHYNGGSPSSLVPGGPPSRHPSMAVASPLISQRIITELTRFGWEGVVFFVSTCVAVAYYIVKVHVQAEAGEKTGPVVEAPEQVLSYGVVITAFLLISAYNVPVPPGPSGGASSSSPSQRELRIFGWTVLHLLCLITLISGSSGGIANLIPFPGILFIFFVATKMGESLMASTTSYVAPSSSSRREAGTENFHSGTVLPVVMVTTVTLLGWAMDETREKPFRDAFVAGSMSEEVMKSQCRYEYAFFPPSEHKISQWSQASGLGIGLLGLVRYVPKLEQKIRSLVGRRRRSGGYDYEELAPSEGVARTTSFGLGPVEAAAAAAAGRNPREE
ncbi:hypothetical protein B0H63DRAFT_155818 [Podospora didyma]|uniref:Uncharacterized protein n=1 Tax=Podospora didyma TaxID=330526 RepID=A0AAE0NT99_9PEZI|nr:hypothetical protein B0H63DRAFT_155818 [Podospora didyma]